MSVSEPGAAARVAILRAVDIRDGITASGVRIERSQLQGCSAIGAVPFKNDRVIRRDKEGAIWRPNAEKGIEYSHVILLVGDAIWLFKVQVQREK